MQPFFAGPGERCLAQQISDHQGQDNAQQSGENSTNQRLALRPLHFGEPHGTHLVLHLRHGVNGFADRVHFQLAAVGAHKSQGTLQSLFLSQCDRLSHFIKLQIHMLAQLVEALALTRIILGTLGDLFQLTIHGSKGSSVGREIAIFAGQQIAALPGFRVLKLGQQALERNDGAVCFNNALIGHPQPLKIDIGDQPAHDEKHQSSSQAHRHAEFYSEQFAGTVGSFTHCHENLLLGGDRRRGRRPWPLDETASIAVAAGSLNRLEPSNDDNMILPHRFSKTDQ